MKQVFIIVHSPTKSRLLQLLAPVQTIAKLQQADIVLRDLVNQVLACSELAQSEFVVIFVVQYIHEGGKERVNILKQNRLTG